MTNAYYRVDTGVNYKVKNGICHVYVSWLYVKTVSDSWQAIANNLPKPSEIWIDMRNYFGRESKPGVGVRVDTAGILYAVYGGTNCEYNFTISYPIA